VLPEQLRASGGGGVEEVARSLFWIAACAAVAPLAARLVPRRLVPEVVLLLVLGVLIGPNALGLATTEGGIDLLRQLGLGMLFLLAGFEIELDELTGPGGRRAILTWVVCFGLALAVVGLLGLTGAIHAEIAIAIALTSTALGTLLPILKDNGMLDGAVGRSVLNHGAIGELGPIVAMAVLLGANGAAEAVLSVVLFAVLAALMSAVVTRVRPGSRVHHLVGSGAESTGQTTVRLVVLLLAALGLLAIAFDLDVVLGAFAAGFVLRQALPSGNESLEHKLEGLAFGLLIPVFFVTSGMAIDPRAVVEEPIVLVMFVVLIVVLRGGPVVLSSLRQRDPATGSLLFDTRDSVRIGLYAATGLPIIVAVTSVAVSSGQMTSLNASLLVAGGAFTVLLMPMTATLIAREPAEAETR